MCLLCGRPVFARRWCKLHYQHWYRTGDPQMVRRARQRPGPRPNAYQARVLALWLAGWRTSTIARHLGIRMQRVTQHKVALAARMGMDQDDVLPAYIKQLRHELAALREAQGMREAS